MKKNNREAREEAALLVVLDAASKGHWQAAAWFLERSNPEKYALPQSLGRHLHRLLQEGKIVADRIDGAYDTTGRAPTTAPTPSEQLALAVYDAAVQTAARFELDALERRSKKARRTKR